MAHNYILQVTAGSDYDITKHQIVPVNDSKPVTIDSEHLSVDLNVRIQSYRGLPRESPTTSPYFDLPPHDKNKDQYSISFQFRPKSNINGDDLVFGNDFDHPIRDRLPPGFGTAFKIVKWLVDPGLDGDVYADKPYLYGPAASSFNVLYIGGTDTDKTSSSSSSMTDGGHDAGLVFNEGGSTEGIEHRKSQGIPDAMAARKKYFLQAENREGFEWEKGRLYGADFYNPYLDFNDFALRLPGFTLPIMTYWDGQGLRYVLKNRKTDTVLFVVLFTLYLKEDVKENGQLIDGVEGGKPLALMDEREREKHRRAIYGGGNEEDEDEDEDESNDEEKDDNKANGEVEEKFEDTNEDDVD